MLFLLMVDVGKTASKQHKIERTRNLTHRPFPVPQSYPMGFGRMLTLGRGDCVCLYRFLFVNCFASIDMKHMHLSLISAYSTRHKYAHYVNHCGGMQL